jgi:hypothetical protein
MNMDYDRESARMLRDRYPLSIAALAYVLIMHCLYYFYIGEPAHEPVGEHDPGTVICTYEHAGPVKLAKIK